jgi:hypothetical protein
MVKVSKKSLENSGLILLVVYFIFDGLQKLMDNKTEGDFFARKIENLQVYLFNNGLLLFNFASVFTTYARLWIVIYGLIEFVAAVGLIFFDEREKRVKFLTLITVFTILDAFVLHNPFIEHGKNLHLETKHCLLSLTIASSLLMVAGFRKY